MLTTKFIGAQKVLVTGGASGIGLGLVGRFVELGCEVLICGRKAETLMEAQKTHPSVIAKVCDLESEADRVNLFNWVRSEHPDLNILVNNAGVQNWMSLDDEDFMKKTRSEIAINIEAPLHLGHLFSQLPGLKMIMNVTSGLAFVPLTKVPVYSATKAFMHSFSLSQRYLLQSKGIEVIEIIPPALNTDLGAPGLHSAHPPVSAFIDAIFAQLEGGQRDKLTFGFSAAVSCAGPEQLEATFKMLNPEA